jgi:transcriptional regulator GlxA family with amidase domain
VLEAASEVELVAEAAHRAGLSERRFSQLFREITGSSWLSHLRALRLDHATRLLRHTERSITAIAFECGFTDLSNFYRAFKTANDCSPLELRSGR